MIWLLLLILCLGSGNMVSQSSSILKVVNGVLGESVTLPLKLPAREEVKLIIWNYHRDISVSVTLIIIHLNEFTSPQIIKADPERGNRLNVTQSYSLQLSNLTMADKGIYNVQITLKNSTPEVSRYMLRVFKRLGDLQVTNHTRLSENGSCEIHLVCTGDDLNYAESFRWLASGNISLSEPNLTVSWDPKNSSDQSYTCIAENPVSNFTVTVSAQSLCKGVFLMENLHRNNIWKIMIPLFILIIILVVICVWKKRRDSSQNREYAVDSPGNTVYAQVTHPNQRMNTPTSIQNDSVTIYSIINHQRD